VLDVEPTPERSALQIIGDLISYQNDGKGCAAMVGNAEKA
jgi:hypothetical protein